MKPFTQLSIALVVLAAALSAYGSAYLLVSRSSATAAELRSQVDARSAAAARIAIARSALTELAEDEATVRGYFVSEERVVQFISDLEARGRATGASVEVLSVSAGQGATVSQNLTLALSITGGFSSVLRALGAIEYAPYHISVASLSLRKGLESGWRADVRLDVGAAPSATPEPAPPTEP